MHVKVFIEWYITKQMRSFDLFSYGVVMFCDDFRKKFETDLENIKESMLTC